MASGKYWNFNIYVEEKNMKILANLHIKRLCLILAILFGIAVIGCECERSKAAIDPLEGFHLSSLKNLQSNKAISDDYQNYIQKILSKNGGFVGSVNFFENESGERAVDIRIGVNGAWWKHILIYDRDNKRVNVIKYRTGGGYRS
jgi:hypothetical protein